MRRNYLKPKSPRQPPSPPQHLLCYRLVPRNLTQNLVRKSRHLHPLTLPRFRILRVHRLLKTPPSRSAKVTLQSQRSSQLPYRTVANPPPPRRLTSTPTTTLPPTFRQQSRRFSPKPVDNLQHSCKPLPQIPRLPSTATPRSLPPPYPPLQRPLPLPHQSPPTLILNLLRSSLPRSL